MAEFDARAQVEKALEALSEGLGPVVAAKFAELVPAVADWTELLARKDRQAGRNFSRYNNRDLSLMLRALTEAFGSLGYPFAEILGRQGQSWASELRNVRNKWAHYEEFSVAETYRALDTAEMLLNKLEVEEPARRLGDLKRLTLAEMAAESPTPGPQPADALTGTAAPEPVARSTDIPPDGSFTPEAIATISMDALPDLSYAHARNSIAVVDEVVIDYRGPELRGASVEVEAICASGSLGDPKVLIVDLDGSSPTTLRNADVLLDPARMIAVENPTQGTIKVLLRDAGGSVIAEHNRDVTVLAANQWRANPPQLSLELLASFVQPNSPAIPPLLVEASDRLMQTTGNNALDGYQQGSRQRVDAIVEAIYESMRARDIRYAEPPASWGLEGQKVRTPAEVLEGRLGTCLDMTVTMAAALEEASINSTLWLLKGHIFLGYWRDDASLDGPAQTEAAEVANYVGIGQMEIVETTFATGGTMSKPFAEARRHQHLVTLAADISAVQGVTDIMQARLARVFPLPSRSVSEAGDVTIHEYAVMQAPTALHYDPTSTMSQGQPAEAVPARVAQWKNALLDLSLRNRLINYGEKSGYSLAVPQPALGKFEDMINSGTSVSLVPLDRIPTVDGSRGIRFGHDLPETTRAGMLTERKQAFVSVTEASYTARLRALAYKARTITEETGANNLYLAFGMLRWTFNDRELRSPLVLVPVTLNAAGGGNTFRISLDEAGESTPNYCLLEKLRVSFGLVVPGLSNPVKDDSGIDLAAAFSAMRRSLAASRLAFTVEDTVDLSILQFAKYRLWKDLDENWRELSQNSLVKHLIDSPTREYADPFDIPASTDLDVLGNSVPVPADSSQLDAVAEANANRTFVLEGPPGTGKSQTITNVLAHSLANGKRVLFVAEKRAALDVVKSRLDAVGLGPFSLDLHDKGARPTAMRAQLRTAIDTIARPDGAALKANTESAATSRGSLKRYAQRLHEPNSAGLSLYSARDRLLASAADVEALDVPAKLVATATEEQFTQLRDILRSLPETADLAHPAELHPWGFVSVRTGSALDTASVHSAAQEFDAALAALFSHDADFELLALVSAPEHLDRWSALVNAPRYSLAALDAIHPRVLSGEVSALQARLNTSTADLPWFSSVGPEALDEDVQSIHQAAVAADASGFFGRRKRQRAVLASFGSALRVDPRKFPARDVTALTREMAQTADEIGSLRQALTSLPVPLISPQWNPHLREGIGPAATTLSWVVWLSSALAPNAGNSDLQQALRRYYSTSAPDGALAAILSRLASAWRTLAASSNLSEPTGDRTDEFSRWAGQYDLFSVWQHTAGARKVDTATPITLDRWIAFLQHLEPLVQFGMQTAHDALRTGRMPADLAALALDKGIAQASITERSDSQALVEFDVPAHSRTIDRFTASTSAIRAELPRWLPAEIIANRRINPSYEGGMMGELRRQLSRQRGGMSVRALLENYGDLITQITPCVLMSPESVARFFPAKSKMFDIVVFDEASQIRVADAVGAMGRGTSVVVVGDSKQMPPTSFAETSNDIELDATTADVIADEESILTECVQARVPRKWLSWHYRSQDEALISFSNHAYYDSRLSSFPAPLPEASLASDADHGISLVRIAGHFNRSGRGRDLRTNAAEAEAIVREVTQRFAKSPHAAPSLGIITFNAQQRTLIEMLLRDAEDERIPRAVDERDGLFVKNLENVQGDERDTILFSVAFSANAQGVLPLNFGPLSRAGGERRLNVAITRARRQVVLFASFDPSDLRAEETASVGIKHLKAYLELAASGIEPTQDILRRERLFDRHRDEIADALREKGLVVSTDIGLSDFRVDISIADPAAPSQPLVAVLLDGEGWRARRTVADRDGLPISVLRDLMKWPGVERVWLPEWLQQRESTVARLVASVAQAREAQQLNEAEPDRPAEQSASSTPAHATESTPTVPTLVRTRAGSASSSRERDELRHSNLRQYVEWEPKRFGSVDTLDRLPQRGAAEKVRAVLHEIVQKEGPIHKMRLARLAAESFGLNRVAGARAEAILRCLPQEYQRTSDKTCAWPANVDPRKWHDIRRSEPGSGRNLDHVPLEEIANAMAVVAELGGGMNEEEIKRQALALFGGKRLTEGISSRLTSGLQRGLESGRIEQDDRGLIRSVTLF